MSKRISLTPSDAAHRFVGELGPALSHLLPNAKGLPVWGRVKWSAMISCGVSSRHSAVIRYLVRGSCYHINHMCPCSWFRWEWLQTSVFLLDSENGWSWLDNAHCTSYFKKVMLQGTHLSKKLPLMRFKKHPRIMKAEIFEIRGSFDSILEKQKEMFLNSLYLHLCQKLGVYFIFPLYTHLCASCFWES